MATPEELLAKLEERFILDEISEASYHELKAKLEARLAGDVSSSAGGQIIGDDNVIRGDISNTTKGGSVGSVVFNIPREGSMAKIVDCPLCGRRNEYHKTFLCLKCQRDHLCLDHFDTATLACTECVAMDERPRTEAELKRRVKLGPEAAEAESRRNSAETPSTMESDRGKARASSGQDAQAWVLRVLLILTGVAAASQVFFHIWDRTHRSPPVMDIYFMFINPTLAALSLIAASVIAFRRHRNR